MSLISATILLFLVMDPFGNIPFFLCVLQKAHPSKRLKIISREMLISLMIFVIFLAGGSSLLMALQISEPSLRMAGGIILFLIAIKMIFGGIEEMFTDSAQGEPFIVPLAVPSVAGPSALATILLLVGQQPEKRLVWLLAILIAWVATGTILSLSVKLGRFLGAKGINALQRLKLGASYQDRITVFCPPSTLTL